MYNSRRELEILQRIQEMLEYTCPNCGSVGEFQLVDDEEDTYVCKNCSYESSIREDIQNQELEESWYELDD